MTGTLTQGELVNATSNPEVYRVESMQITQPRGVTPERLQGRPHLRPNIRLRIINWQCC